MQLEYGIAITSRTRQGKKTTLINFKGRTIPTRELNLDEAKRLVEELVVRIEFGMGAPIIPRSSPLKEEEMLAIFGHLEAWRCRHG